MTIFYTNNPERNVGAKTTQDPLTPQSGGSSQNITGAGQIASAEAIGQPALSPVVASAGIGTAEALGGPDVGPVIASTGIASAEAIGQPDVGVAVDAIGITSAEAVGAPTVEGVGGAHAITGVGGITSAEAVGAPTIEAVATVIAPAGSSGGKIRRRRMPLFSVETPVLPVVAHEIRGAGGIASEEAVGMPIVSVQAEVIQIRSRIEREREDMELLAA